ncbi:MAG: GTP cyclohydrolase I [Microbacteriaceae bacterium]
MSDIDARRIEAAVTELLIAIGEDPLRDELVQTPRRVAEAWAEFFAGVGVDARTALASPLPAEQAGAGSELVVLRGLQFRSMCEHHLLPFMGTAVIGYLPGPSLAGLGDIARVLEIVAARPQLQERLGDQVAEVIAESLSARGVLVVLQAEHQCVRSRGPRQTGSATVTLASRGALSDPVRRAEVLTLAGIEDLG